MHLLLGCDEMLPTNWFSQGQIVSALSTRTESNILDYFENDIVTPLATTRSAVEEPCGNFRILHPALSKILERTCTDATRSIGARASHL